MATRKLVVKELDDMTECCICNEVFTDPRVLPCQHTFCLKCLLNYVKDKQPGDDNDLPCPLCRNEFTIPAHGLSRIQKNFFMEKLIRCVRKLSAREEAGHILCDVCSSDDEARPSEATAEAKPATKHCLQCQENYCDQCSWCHTKMKATASHAMVEIGKELQKEEIAQIETHKGKDIEVFCLECQLALYVMERPTETNGDFVT